MRARHVNARPGPRSAIIISITATPAPPTEKRIKSLIAVAEAGLPGNRSIIRAEFMLKTAVAV